MHIRTTFTFAATLGLGALSTAMAGPTGGVVVSGQGSISTPSTNTTVIDQSSQQLNLNWNTFNVAANENVQFHQPTSSAVAFNRILDQNPSQVFGRIDANGKVVLVNPNGLLIGRSAQLNVNSLVVSSLDAIDFDAASGRYRFSTNRLDPGAVINEGSITAGPGGSVTLLGGHVSNVGSIVADYGTVNLAAGRAATLDLAGDGLLKLEVGADLLSNGSGAVAAVENSGNIQANGGQVLLTANAVRDVFANLINNTGVVRANRIENVGGAITLLGPEGTVLSSGTLDASAHDGASTGGSVALLGEQVGLGGSAVVDVSGANGGGTALIGGDYQGHNPDVLNAKRTFVGADVTLNADAGANGEGGRVIVWSDEATRFDGNLSARGGSSSGNGGFAEVSGKQSLSFTGGVNLSAAHGDRGSLLLDPVTLEIDASTALPAPGPPYAGGVVYDFGDGFPSGTKIGVSQISTLLTSSDVILRADTNLFQSADIDLPANTPGANQSLTLESHGTMSLTNISMAGGALTLNATGLLTLDGALSTGNAPLNVDVGAIAMNGTASINNGFGSVTLNAHGLLTDPAGADIGIGGGITTTGAPVTITSQNGSITLDPGVAISAGNAAVKLQAADLVTFNGSVIRTGASGDVTLDGGAIAMGNASQIQGGAGDVTVHAGTGDLDFDGVVTNNGAVSLTSDLGKVTMTNAVPLNAGTGAVTVSGRQAVQVAGITTLGAASVTSTLAGITQTVGSLLDVANNTLTLNAFNDAGGSGAGALNTRAGTLAGTVGHSLYVHELNGVELNGVTAGQSGAGDLQVTSDSGDIAVRTAKTADTAKLNAQSGGSIVNNTLGTGLQATTVDLTANAAIGADGNPLATKASTIKAQANGGDIFIGNTNAAGVTLDTVTASAGNTVDITSSGAMTVGMVTATAGTVNLTGTSIVDDNNNSPTSLITAQALTLKASTSGIGAVGAGDIDTKVTTLDTQSSGDIYIHEADGLTLNDVTASGHNVTVTSDTGDIKLGGIASANAVALTASSGNIVDDTANIARVVATTLTLSATGGIGVSGTPITTGGTTLTAHAGTGGGNGGVYVDADNTITLQDVTANGTPGAINVSTSAGNIVVGTMSAPNTVTLNAFGVITDDGSSATRITAQDLVLSAKSIGSSTAGAEIDTDVATLDATTSGGTGDVYIGEANGLTLTNISAAGTSTGANVNVTTASGNITVGVVGGRTVTLNATNGSLVDDGVDANAITATSSLDLEAHDAIGATGLHNDIDISGGMLTAHAGNGGNGGAYIHSAGAVILANVTAAGASGDINVGGAGNITVRTVTAPNTVTLTAAGTIRRDANPNLVSAQDLVLSGTSIGASGTGNEIDTDVATLTATASNGGVYISDQNGLALTNVSASGTGNDVNIGSTNGNIAVGVVAGGAVTLNAANGEIVDDAVDTTRITATSLDLEVHDAIGDTGSSKEIDTDVGTLTAHAGNGGVYINAINNLTLASVTAAGTNGDINIKDTSGNLTVQTVSAPNTVTLDASGAISDDGANGTRIGANALVLTAGTGIGAAGTNNEVDTNASTLTATANNGGVYINELNGLTLAAVTAAGAGHDVSITSNTGDIVVAAVNATNAVTLTATTGSVADDADDSTRIVANGLTLQAGTAIGASGGNKEIDVSAPTLAASAGNGGVYVRAAANLALTNVSAAGANGDIDIATPAGSLTVGTVNAPGAVSLSASGAIADDADNTTRIGANALTLTANTAIGAAGANNEIDTNVSTLTAIAANGGVYIGETNGLTLANVIAAGAGSDVSVTSASGDIVVGAVSAPDLVTLAATTGAVTDDDNDATVINGVAGVSLSAGTAVGTVTDFGTVAGSSVDVMTNGALSASVASNTGQINLNISGSPTLAAGAITLGSGTGRAGTVVLQSAGDLNVAGLTAGAINIGAGNTTNVGLVSGGVLTLPTGGGITDAPASSLLVHGSVDVVDNDVNPREIAIAANSLNFQSGAVGGATVLNTSVDRLDATVGSHDLTVNETDGVTLGTLSAGAKLTLTAGGAVADDGDNSTRITGDTVTLAGTALGTPGNELDTQAFMLDATASAGGIHVREIDDLRVLAHATGGAVDVRNASGILMAVAASGTGVTLASGGGNLTLLGAIDAGTGPVSLAANGANSNVIIDSTVNTTGDATITAGPGGAVVLAGSTTHVSAHALTVSGSSIGNSSQRLNTAVDSLTATAQNGGIYVNEDDALSLTATATGGPVQVSTTNGALTVASATGDGITFVAGGDGNALTVDGALNGGSAGITLVASGAAAAINLNNAVSTTGNVFLQAGSAGSRGAITTNGGQIAGDLLIANAASIGANGSPLNTAVNSLSAIGTNGGVYVQEADGLDLLAAATGPVQVTTTNGTLNASNVSGEGVTLVAGGASSDLNVGGSVVGGAGQVTLDAGNAMTLVGAVATSGNMSLTTHGTGSALTLNSSVSANQLAITVGPASGRGAIVAGAGNQILASDATMVSSAIGADGAPLNTSLGSLDARTTDGGIFVNETDALALNAVTTNGALVVRTADGPLTVASAVGDGVTLTTAGDGSSITVNGGSSGGVQARGGDVLLMTSGTASHVTLDAAVSAGGSVTTRTAGDGSDIVLNAAVSSGDSTTVLADGAGSNVTLNSNIDATGDIVVAAGKQTSPGAIVAGTGNKLTGQAVSLTGGSIGGGSARVNTAAASLKATSRNGGTFINQTGALALNGRATGGVLDVQSDGPLTVASATGNGVTLTTTAAGADIAVNGAVDAGSGALTLAANGAGSRIALNDAVSTAGSATLTAGSAATRGAITMGAAGRIGAASLTATGSSIGSTANRLITTVGTLNATSTNGGTFVSETDALTLTASATGGALDVQTGNGALTVTSATGKGVTLTAGGAGSGITLNGAVDAGTSDVTLTAGTVASRGTLVAASGNKVTGATLTAASASIGSSSAALNTNIDTLNANASSGDVYVREQDGIKLADVRAGGKVDIGVTSGNITVNSVNASGDVSLAASAGSIVDDGDNSTRLAGKAVTLLARSIGAPSTMTGTTLDSKARLDIDATSLAATATAGGIFIDSLNGLASTSLHASGGADGDIELLTAAGDINLLSVSASDTLLLAAGRNIYGLPTLGTITARAAELRAGGADSSEGHIGTLLNPLSLQLSAGNTLRMFVPQTVDPNDPSRAPSTLPSAGVSSTLGLFSSPSLLALQAGFGQFQGLGDTQFTSPAEALVRSIQNQTATVQSVLGLDWASFDPNVSLFGTLDPSVCLPGDQRDEEQGGAGC